MWSTGQRSPVVVIHTELSGQIGGNGAGSQPAAALTVMSWIEFDPSELVLGSMLLVILVPGCTCEDVVGRSDSSYPTPAGHHIHLFPST